MNKAKNFPQVEKRKTRTYLVTVDEQKYLDGNFIDNYYRKKKKNKIECKSHLLILLRWYN
jgi:hypothetical protein